jgi:excisionase family DNA binding protein
MAHVGTERYGEDRSELEPLLTISRVCELLGVSKQTLYRLMKRGELRPSRVGDRLRFAPADVRDYLERTREPVASP